MNIYTRYVSGDHDKEYFNGIKEEKGHIKLRPLSGQFDILAGNTEIKSLEFWRSVLPRAAFFSGFDSVIFGHVVTMLYKSESTNKICAVSVTKFGCNIYENIILDSSSRFWPACQNLSAEHRGSNVRKALAIANLKNFNKLWNNKGPTSIIESWDETNAGSLASEMRLIDRCPAEIGERLFSLDLVQESEISALVVDVLHDTIIPDKTVTDENNALVTLLGDQMEQLFDPLLEYSPQAMDYTYISPVAVAKPNAPEAPMIGKVIEELFNVQSNFTLDLVSLLQDFIIPLRIHVLSDVSNTTEGSMKVNAVFPPTLDEITRINCILNSTLKVAIGYGYSEVFKVLASLLPFFYKAFARHQANISFFHARFEKFLKHNRAYAFENSEINKKNWTPMIVENLILGSLFELPKLKLIIKRLYDLVLSEQLKASNFESSDFETPENIDVHYRTITETIDSLGTDEPENVKDLKSRIFTPSGKLLTELATDWPEELQYGWMNRKVLAIYEVKNIMPGKESQNGDEILIIFSDYLLFLDMVYAASKESILSIPDVLMNSLVNQKPLPKLSNFPKLKVRYWCDVKQLLAKSYDSNMGQSLSLTAYGNNFFRSKDALEKVVSVSYSMKSAEDSVTSCNNIMTHVCKAQLLHKSSPFHLFKYKDLDLTRFYCAHDLQDYDDESSKSPIVILLNMDEQKARSILQKNSQIFIVLTLSFLNEHTIQISGYNNENSLEVDDVISTDNINLMLKEILSRCMDNIFHSSSLTHVMIEANLQKLDYFVNSLSPRLSKTESTADSKHQEKKTKRKENKSSAQYPKVEHHQKKNEILANDSKSSGRPTFISRFLNKLRPSHGKEMKIREKSSQRRYAEIPKTGIPRGKKPAYKKLYKPVPSLRESSIVSSTITRENESNGMANETSDEQLDASNRQSGEQPRILSNYTASSSRYSGSVHVASNFQFPAINELERISEDITESCDPNSLERCKGNMGSVRYVPKKDANKLEKDNTLMMSDPILPIPQQKPDVWVYQETSERNDDFKNANTDLAASNGSKKGENGKVGRSMMHDFIYPVVEKSEPISDDTMKAKSPILVPEVENSSTFSKVHKDSKKAEIVHQKENPWVREVPSSDAVIKSSSIKSKSASVSSPAAAWALENLNPSGLSSRIYSKYKIYEELPMSIFNSDAEANWTAFSRDSYSNLQAEIQAMKSVVQDRKTSSMKSFPNPMMMRPNLQQYDSADDTFSTFEFVSYAPENDSYRSTIQPPKSIYDLPPSLRNSSIEIVDSFVKEIDRNFSMRVAGLTGSSSQLQSPHGSEPSVVKTAKESEEDREKDTYPQPESPSTVQHSEHKMMVDNNFTSSDEEYFSSHEISNALEFWIKDAEQEQEQETYLLTSSSSEKTLMNDFMSQSEKKLGSAPFYPHTSLWDANERDLELVDNFGSIAYLSDILTGEVQI